MTARSPIPALDELEHRLVVAIAQAPAAGAATPTRLRQSSPRVRRPRRRPLAVIAAAVVTTVVAAVGVPGLVAAPAQAQMAVLAEGEDYVLEFSVLSGDTDAVNDELRSLGLDFDVAFLPGSPSLVGELVGGSYSAEIGDLLDSDNAFLPGVELDYLPAERPGGDIATLRIDPSMPHPEVLYVGRRAEPGESYAVTAKATEAGEPLACVEIWRPVEDVAALITDHGLKAEYRRDEGGPTPSSLDEVRGTSVTDVLSLDAETLVVFVAQTPLTAAEQAERRPHYYAGCG